jgi:hypothetical protein
MRPVHAILSYVFRVHFKDIFQSMTGSSKQVSTPKSCMHLSSIPWMSHAPLTIFLHYLITQITAIGTNCGSPYYAIFSSLLLLSPSLAQILSTIPKSLILSPSTPFNVRNQVSHSYKTGKIMVPHNNLYVLRQKTGRQKILNLTAATIP